MNSKVSSFCGVLFLSCALIGIATAAQCRDAPLEVQQFQRPIPLGVNGSNSTPAFLANGGCTIEFGTLGALLVDQNNIQYILSAAHVLALGTNGYFTTGTPEPITQPNPLAVLPEPRRRAQYARNS